MLKVRELAVFYGASQALFGMDLDVAAGEAWAIGSSYVAAVGRPLALHRATEGWVAEPVPVDSDTTTVGLHDIVVLPSGEAWAVGSVKAREPFAVRWDGVGFVRIATADLGVQRGGADGLAEAAQLEEQVDPRGDDHRDREADHLVLADRDRAGHVGRAVEILSAGIDQIKRTGCERPLARGTRGVRAA